MWSLKKLINNYCVEYFVTYYLYIMYLDNINICL